MKRKNAGELEGRESSSILTYMRCFVVYPAFVILACIPLLTFFAIGVMQRLIAACISLMSVSIGGHLTMFWGMFWFVAYAVWLLLTGQWSQLISLLPEMLDWLRSFGLL